MSRLNNKFGKILLNLFIVILFAGICSTAKTLLDYKNNPNLYLYKAAKKGQFDYVKSLIEKQDADINYKTNTGNSVLMRAVKSKREKVIDYLLSLKDKEDKILVKLDFVNKHGQTALHKAVIVGDLNSVKVLLKVRCGKNIQDRHGNTPLHLAVKKGLVDIVKELVLAGADLNIKNNSEFTPFDEAKRSNYRSIADILSKA